MPLSLLLWGLMMEACFGLALLGGALIAEHQETIVAAVRRSMRTLRLHLPGGR